MLNLQLEVYAVRCNTCRAEVRVVPEAEMDAFARDHFNRGCKIVYEARINDPEAWRGRHYKIGFLQVKI